MLMPVLASQPPPLKKGPNTQPHLIAMTPSQSTAVSGVLDLPSGVAACFDVTLGSVLTTAKRGDESASRVKTAGTLVGICPGTDVGVGGR